MFLERTVERRLVQEIGSYKRVVYEVAMARGKIVIDDGSITRGGKRPAAMRADIPRASCNENSRLVSRGNVGSSFDHILARL